MNNECKHIVTQGREGEKGSWCVDCGVKVYEVETRQCKDCKHFKKHEHQIPLCTKLLMTVIETMNVTFKVTEGSCFESKSQSTKIWISWNGTKTPLPLMTDDHMKSAYAVCVKVTLGNKYILEPSGQGRSEYQKKTTLTLDEAKKWIPIFEDEAKRRKIKLPKIDKDTYQYELGNKMMRKRSKLDKFNRDFNDKNF